MNVFISSSSRDAESVSRIRTLLTQNGFKVWDPERELLPGSNWLAETGKALEDSDAVVFVLSGDPHHEPFARREVQYVISHAKYEDHVVTVRLPGSEKIPWILNHMPVIDATDGDVDRAAQEIALHLQPVKRRKRVSALTRRLKAPKKRTSRSA